MVGESEGAVPALTPPQGHLGEEPTHCDLRFKKLALGRRVHVTSPHKLTPEGEPGLPRARNTAVLPSWPQAGKKVPERRRCAPPGPRYFTASTKRTRNGRSFTGET